ncbi:hypothetical protein KGD83_00235 [Nocardiopsis akebiae]|uniref:DUF4145 domain-containing protein n=1 Tax=Nocardiopsis akebiae TaxID=2831968 RepID=A0ABX8C3X3_9ACTN|nr:hypothetical protein [Nocardiopsis akebiae]QUX29085.1 hypothetical protein KGD83_00235 [Nocardiopsis akebiae]
MKKTEKAVWIPLNEHQWERSSGSSDLFDRATSKEYFHARRSFDHAEYRILRNESDYDRTDAILALKRSIRSRLEHLNEKLDFKTIPGPDSGDWLGKLESIGVIRKSTLKKLNQVRNTVEHDGASPPSIEECESYAEAVWYFLKVTTLCLNTPTSAELTYIAEDASVNFHINVEISYSPLEMIVYGYVPRSHYSTARIEGWLELTHQPEVLSRVGLPTDLASTHTINGVQLDLISSLASEGNSATRVLNLIFNLN